MRRHVLLWLVSMGASSVIACGDDGAGGDGTTGGEPTSGDGADDNLTLPVTTATPGDDGVDDSQTASGSGTDGGSGTGDPDGTGSGTMGADESSGSGDDAGSSEESSTGGAAAVTIEWCRLQSPATAEVMVSEAFTVYGRVYVEGVTDQSVNNDPYPALVAEVGWGEVDSDPAAGAWTWVEATPNPGWDGTTFGEPNNDEYMADLEIDTAGTFHYAVRFSGDSGNRWVYCDLDDLLTGGYTPDQAGLATIAP
jgi:hypothetical protein